MISTLESRPILNISIYEGIDICVNDEHPENAEDPIEITDEGIEICVKDEHPEKAPSLISVTDEGIVICVNDEHLKKA